jgi:HD superfamily phosphohydrolase
LKKKEESSEDEEKTLSYPDPVQGHIDLPIWLVDIMNLPLVRRMLFIRQLGLKAYIDFPGAIHTRYSHALGCMHLAGKMVDVLETKERNAGNTNIAMTLHDNKNNLMAAGFFHDIGHGPFSHAADYVTKKLSGKGHEQVSTEMLDFPVLRKIEQHVTIRAVQEIFTGKHALPFLREIIDGPLDIDKLDYLLRDSYHVGLRYSFDLDHFISAYKILGDDHRRDHCRLGLDNTPEAITTCEVFLIIWKSMYEMVYNKRKSRVAEKMLEKAVLLAADQNSTVKEYFTNIKKYSELHDELLLEELEKAGDRPRQIVEMIRAGETYAVAFNRELKAENFQPPLEEAILNDRLLKDESEVADRLSELLCERLRLQKYDAICDIVKGKVPKAILLNQPEVEGEPPELKGKSDIVKAILPRNSMKVYLAPSAGVDPSVVATNLSELLRTWT